MATNDKIERDFRISEAAIKAMADEELRRIREKIAQIKQEAEKIGEDVEADLAMNDKQPLRKKLNIRSEEELTEKKT
jgi:hypothetical protein